MTTVGYDINERCAACGHARFYHTSGSGRCHRFLHELVARASYCRCPSFEQTEQTNSHVDTSE